jgi:hypothetical protein
LSTEEVKKNEADNTDAGDGHKLSVGITLERIGIHDGINNNTENNILQQKQEEF